MAANRLPSTEQRLWATALPARDGRPGVAHARAPATVGRRELQFTLTSLMQKSNVLSSDAEEIWN